MKSHAGLGPNVTVITGNHMTLPGRFFLSFRDEEKLPEYDEDVVIEEDVWVGANVTILKGVTIGRSSIISAGWVVTKDVEPYTIVGGVPAKFIRYKFGEEEIEFHEKALFGKK